VMCVLVLLAIDSNKLGFNYYNQCNLSNVEVAWDNPDETGK